MDLDCCLYSRESRNSVQEFDQAGDHYIYLKILGRGAVSQAEVCLYWFEGLSEDSHIC